MYIISSHARFSDTGQLVNGTSSQLILYLQRKRIKYISLFHSLFVGFPTLLEINRKQKKVGLSFLPFSLKLIQDTLITILNVLQYKNNIDVFIGINPINASIGSLLKKIGVLKKVVYYTADFSLKRFGNPLLNSFYLFLDDFSVRNADAVWNVSTRIQREREKKYGKNKKFFVLPNSLPFPGVIKSKRDTFALVLVSHLTKSIHFDMLVDAVALLKKKFPKISLQIAGDGYEKERIEKYVVKKHLEKHIFFHGHMPHKNVLQLLKKSGIGLGIYTNDNPWTKYGDSMKVREYVAYGLPVIITNVPSTAEDIEKYNAGIVVHQNKKEFVTAVSKLLSEEYMFYQKNAYKMARYYDSPLRIKKALDISLKR